MMDHVSFSSLTAFEACPASWLASKTQPETNVAHRDTGRLIHAVIAEYLTECQTSGIEAYPTGIPAIVERVLTREGGTQYADAVLIAAKGYAKRTIVDDSIIAIEQPFRVLVPGAGTALVGIPDLVHQLGEHHVGIEDLKAGWASTQSDDHRYQLALYAWAWHEQHPTDRVSVRNQYVRQGIVTEWDEMQPWDYETTLVRMRATALRMQAAEEAQAYPAKPGARCARCPIARQCSQRAKVQSIIIDDDSARSHLADYLRYQAHADALKERLHEWVDAHGESVVLNGSRAGYSEAKPSRSIAPHALVDLLGEDAWSYLTADARKTAKLAKDERLEGAWDESVAKPRFAIGKA